MTSSPAHTHDTDAPYSAQSGSEGNAHGTPSEPSKRSLLFIVHDGALYGSQQSLLLMLRHMDPAYFNIIVSIAREGPLLDELKTLPHVRVLKHKRLQWVKHSHRSWLQHFGDLISLALTTLPRSLSLASWVKKHKIDLVHTNSVVSLEGALAAKIARVPHVWHIRELFALENPKIFTLLGRSLTAKVIEALSDKILCISKAVEQQFSPQLHGKKTHVLYNALAPQGQSAEEILADDIASKLPSRTHRFRLGYLGRMSEGKRFTDILDALCLLKEEKLPIELMVAGGFADESYQWAVEDKVRQFGLSPIIVWLGIIPDTAPFFSAIDALVVPSLNEPFGRVIIEAMAAGVPCIAAKSGGIPELITHHETGYLFPPKDIAAMVRCIRESIHDSQNRLRIRQNARRIVFQRFTIEKQMAELLQCYDALCPFPVGPRV